MFIINKGPILHFHYHSFIEFLFSFSFSQDLPEFSAVQNLKLHDYQLAVVCLNTMASSALSFNICALKTSDIRKRNIPAIYKLAISPLLSYSCQFWTDHLVDIPYEKTLIKVVQFVMYDKLLSWMEVMSISGRVYEITLILKRTLAWLELKVCCSFFCYGTYPMLAG